MADTLKMLEEMDTAVVACDADLVVTYANEKCKAAFKALLNMENFVGKPMGDCHKPETMEKFKVLVEKYKAREIKLDYYRMDVPDGKLTIVNVPTYQGDTFSGIVEFIFEDALD